jgi:hypothetical protein
MLPNKIDQSSIMLAPRGRIDSTVDFTLLSPQISLNDKQLGITTTTARQSTTKYSSNGLNMAGVKQAQNTQAQQQPTKSKISKIPINSMY